MQEFSLPRKFNWELANEAITPEPAASLSCGQKFTVNPNTLGPKVSFRRVNNAPNVRDIIIPGVLEIARGNGQGIYNAAQEEGYDTNSPAGTEWNSNFTDPIRYGWNQLGTVKARTFNTWKNSLGANVGYNIIGKELVMRSTDTGQVFLIMFTEWTGSGSGGGFAYDRYEVFPVTNFYRPSLTPNKVDIISDGLIIKRDNAQGLYNFILESEYDTILERSPLGTEWNSNYTDNVLNGWSNLNNIRNRKYGTWKQAINNNPPQSVISGLQLVMHDLSTDLYWQVIFTDWGSGGNNGEVGYTRTLIVEDCGITFANGEFMAVPPTGGSGSTPTLAEVLTAGNNTGGISINSPNTDNSLFIDNTYIDLNSNGGTRGITISPTEVTIYDGDNLIQLSAPSVTKNGEEVATIKYKIFTATITQSGAENGDTTNSLDPLIIGATYRISANVNLDATNVGAPNNDVGTWFIATGTTCASGGPSASFFYDSAAPVVNILENTIGNIWFSYYGVGKYVANSSGLFTLGKTTSNITPGYFFESFDNPYIPYAYSGNNINIVGIETYEGSFPKNSILGNVLQNIIEIKVYY
jgi:hypothetical protein